LHNISNGKQFAQTLKTILHFLSSNQNKLWYKKHIHRKKKNFCINSIIVQHIFILPCFSWIPRGSVLCSPRCHLLVACIIQQLTRSLPALLNHPWSSLHHQRSTSYIYHHLSSPNGLLSCPTVGSDFLMSDPSVFVLCSRSVFSRQRRGQLSHIPNLFATVPANERSFYNIIVQPNLFDFSNSWANKNRMFP
jgi:hypothetical protein